MTNDPSDEKGQPQGGGTSSGASGDPHPDHESDTINFGKSADFRRRVLDVNSILSGMRRAETVDPSRMQLGQDETAAISPGHSSGQGTIDSGEEIRRKKKSLQGETVMMTVPSAPLPIEMRPGKSNPGQVTPVVESPQSPVSKSDAAPAGVDTSDRSREKPQEQTITPSPRAQLFASKQNSFNYKIDTGCFDINAIRNGIELTAHAGGPLTNAPPSNVGSVAKSEPGAPGPATSQPQNPNADVVPNQSAGGAQSPATSQSPASSASPKPQAAVSPGAKTMSSFPLEKALKLGSTGEFKINTGVFDLSTIQEGVQITANKKTVMNRAAGQNPPGASPQQTAPRPGVQPGAQPSSTGAPGPVPQSVRPAPQAAPARPAQPGAPQGAAPAAPPVPAAGGQKPAPGARPNKGAKTGNEFKKPKSNLFAQLMSHTQSQPIPNIQKADEKTAQTPAPPQSPAAAAAPVATPPASIAPAASPPAPATVAKEPQPAPTPASAPPVPQTSAPAPQAMATVTHKSASKSVGRQIAIDVRAAKDRDLHVSMSGTMAATDSLIGMHSIQRVVVKSAATALPQAASQPAAAAPTSPAPPVHPPAPASQPMPEPLREESRWSRTAAPSQPAAEPPKQADHHDAEKEVKAPYVPATTPTPPGGPPRSSWSTPAQPAKPAQPQTVKATGDAANTQQPQPSQLPADKKGQESKGWLNKILKRS